MFKLFNLKVILAIGFYAIVTLSYNYYTYNKYKKEEIFRIDEKLKLSALTVYDLLGKDFFLKANNKDSISKEEDWKNIRLLTSYNNNAKLAFVFASIKKDGKVYLISSSATNEEIENNEPVFYFYEYKSAKKLVEVFEDNEILYETYSDKWGTFKSIHIPITLENKHKVVISAEIPLDSFNKLLNEIKYKYFLEVLFYLLITIPIILVVYFAIKEKLTIEEKLKNELYNKKKEKENQKLLAHQSKMAAMGEMIGNIAHQWRQPLSLISTSATGAKLQNELGLLNENTLNSYFDTINNTAQYLSQTIEDFRGFFNPKNSTVNKFNISHTIDKSLNLVGAQFTTKEIEVIQNIKDFTLETVENELVQVIINILNNAKDALIKLEDQKRFIFINTYKTDIDIVIEIKDNAKGIPEDIINRVFEPYFTTKHQAQGTGIGLYMSEKIVKNHLDGRLTVSNDNYSYEGVEYIGAKFCITIRC